MAAVGDVPGEVGEAEIVGARVVAEGGEGGFHVDAVALGDHAFGLFVRQAGDRSCLRPGDR